MAAMHAHLLQEPWCFTVEQIADLTAWQAEHLYLRPAHERQNRSERESRGEPEMDNAESFVAEMSAAYPGRTRDEWIADWERIKASETGKE